jgi:lipopolysaccharide export system protein LptA
VVVFDAGATFGGVVSGTTLDLAAGIGTGTLTGFGTNFTGFKDINVAAGTDWEFTGSNVVASGDTLAIAGTLTIDGTIADAGAISVASGGALLFGAGNDVLDLTGNAVLNAQGAVDGGGGTNTLELSGTGGTLSGFASNFTHFQALSVDAGASWTLGGTNSVTAGETLVDDGTLGVSGTFTDDGTIEIGGAGVLKLSAATDVFDLAAGAVLSGSVAGAGGTLELGTGSGTGDIVSLATFTGFGELAVASGATWAVAGTIGAGTLLADQGVLLTTGVLTLEDSITNTGGTLDAAGGVIDLNGVDLTGGTLISSAGGSFSVGGAVASTLTGVALDGSVSIAAGSTLVLAGADTNAGTLSGTVDVTGTLTNEAGGVIQSVTGTGTLVNAGTVSGTAQASVVVFDAGAVFGGVVSGTTLDLAAGIGTGTLNALGTSFTGFKDISVAAGTEWVFTGSNSVASGDTLAIAGTLTIDGTLADAGAISVASGGALLFGSGNDVLDLTGNAVLNAQGAVDGGGGTNTLELSGTGGTLSGFASNFKNFQVLSVDAGASWTLGGTNSVTAGETLVDDGTLSVSGTFTDEGAITIGAGGVLQLSGAADVFDLTAGATLSGSVAGAGGTLELGLGSGAIANLNSFTGFGEVALGSGATWALAGTIGGGTLIANQGVLLATGALALDGTVNNNGGTIDAAGGTIDLNGVDLTGGTLTSSGGGYNYDRGGQVTLTSVAVGGTLELGGLVTLTLAGDSSNAGTIDLGTTPTRSGTDTDITGSFTNTGTITGGSNNDFIIVSGTLENQGVITDNFITIAATGSLVNAAGATIAGGITAAGGPGMLVNAGLLTTPYVTGIYFEAGGYIDNQQGGQIDGQLAIDIQGAAGTVVNAGTIGALYLDSGTVDNAAGGVLSGYVHIGGNAGTLINAGTISGAVTAALVRFDAGAVFGGVVSGDTLELAVGSGIGTLSGFGTNFTGFQSVLVDAGAAWSLAGNNTLTASESLLDLGSLGLNGTLAVDGAATVAAGGTLSVNGALVDAGTISIAAGGALDFGAGNDVFDLTGNAVLDAAGAVDGGGGTNTLELSGIGGTLSGFGTNFVDFQVLSVAAGASWSLAGNNTITATEQLIAAGNLTINGALLDDGGITLASGGTLNVNGTLTDSGTISIASGGALDFGAGNDVFDLTGGAVLNVTGAVDGGGGTNTLELSGTGGTLSGFGTNLTDFQLISLDSGASWKLAGNNVLSAGEQLIDNGTLVITGTLANAGTVADGVTLAAGASLANTGLVETNAANSAGITLRAGTISNAGTIIDSGLNGSAIVATAAAVITNAAGGVIDESSTGLYGDLEAGVDLLKGGTLMNFGLIEAPGSIVDGVILAGGAGLYNAGTITVGAGSGVVIDAGSSATNAAHGEITATGALGRGVNLYGGTLTNDGAIAGAGVGVFLRDPASVSNDGTISGTGGTGVGIYLYAGGSVGNAGLIEGVAEGAYLRGGSLTNTGTLLATGAGGIGLDLAGDAVATDQGLIEGAIGVEELGASATLEVSGTIIGTGGTAIVLGGAGDLLKWDAGAVIDGAIAGGGGTLELAAGSAAIGTLAGLGGTITNFSLIEIEQNALWDLAGQDTLSAGETLDAAGALLISGSLIDEGAVTISGSLDLTGTIDITDGALSVSGALTGSGLIELSDFGSLDLGAAASGGTIDFTDGTGLLTIANAGQFADQIIGFGHGDTIDLTGIAFSSADTVTYSNGHAIVYDNGSIVADFLLSGLPPGAELSLQSDQHGGTDLIDPTGPACFLAGTSLTTAAGEVAVEDLAPGMLVATIAGKLAPIRWIGRRRYDPAALEIGRDKVLPIIIRAGALGENLPRRDLMVSPEHCLYVGAALIPARMLVNGRSIVQRRSLEPIDYIHVELDEHAILLAEGAAAESYREIGNNRAEFAITAGTAVPPSDACAPILTAGPELRAIREALERQAVPVCWKEEVAAA